MNNSEGQQSGKRRVTPADRLKNRLFQKGMGHSSMSSFKSPMASDQANRTLFVNMNSSSTKFSPKVLRKQIDVSPKEFNIQKRYGTQTKNLKKITANERIITKESDFLDQIAKQQRKGYLKHSSSSNFYNKSYCDNINESKQKNQTQTFEQTNRSEQYKRTKMLVQKLSGKSQFYSKEEERTPISFSPKKQEQIVNKQSQQNVKFKPEELEKMTLDNYIARALKKQVNLQQFLYLVNTKNKDGSKDDQEDPYQLYIMQYESNKQIEQKLYQKYYTVSKKGLCFYINGKPSEFIELQEWVIQKQNHQKIKNLKFFNRFRKWKTVKMWRKIVLKHRIEECSKNLEQKLFFLNPIMRSCLFQVQQISLSLGKNMIILSTNQDDFSLQNFKAVQQKTKRVVSGIIQQYSQESRVSVKKCFDQCLKNLQASMKEKEKQQQQEKSGGIADHINMKDVAFQALGFPSKMSYENRSKLRKLASKFIRFSYLVDMLHTLGLSSCFQNQLTLFINKLQQSQTIERLEVCMTKEDARIPNASLNTPEQNGKMFNVKLYLLDNQISAGNFVQVNLPTNEEGLEVFNPIYHVKKYSEDQDQQKRLYCPTICKQWLAKTPQIDDIYEEVSSQIKQSLNGLKFFERWSKHRDMSKFIDILQEWDDAVSQSREVAENQNLDPVIIITNFESSLLQIKNVMIKSQEIINNKVEQEFTELLNIHLEGKKFDIDLFRDPQLQSPAETVEAFLKYMIKNVQSIEKKVPYRIRLGIFQIHLGSIRVDLLKQADDMFNKFKLILPEIMEERTNFMNNWLNKYNEVIEEEVKNIDDFVNKVKCIREIEQTLEVKKQLCSNLSSIYQIMELYKFNTKRRKDFETVTLKLKDQLQKQINEFEQNFQKQCQTYVRQINRNYLPGIVKDINKIAVLIKNQKFINLSKTENYEEVVKQIGELSRKFKDIEQRNSKCLQYQLILGPSREQQGLIDKVKAEVPSYHEDLNNVKNSIECLHMMWEKYQFWKSLINKYNPITVIQILKDREELSALLKNERDVINNRMRKVMGSNEVIEQLDKKVSVFEKYLPIFFGLSNIISETHWEQINELAHKSSSSASLDLKKLDSLTLSDMVSSCIGEFKQEFQQIFVKASNEINLQYQYNQMQKKWKSAIIKTRIEGKYHVIYDEAEQNSVMDLINEALHSMTTIFANPYSIRLQVGVLTYDSIMFVLQAYRRWIVVQRKLIAFDKICKTIDLKKIVEGNLLENTQKQYKSIFKVLLSRNIETYFNITKFLPFGNINISEKLQDCEKMLNALQNNIKAMLYEYKKNYPLFYQLDDGDLLRVIMETTGQQNINSFVQILDELVCQKFHQGIIKSLNVEGERLIGVITIDNENILKTALSLTTDMETILDQINDAIGDYTRRMIRACRSKSLQNSLLDIVDEFNIQFLLAISKVDFSNYTAISIENSQDNLQSLREYLKILGKDTKNGIQKLKNKRTGNILAYETLILQNLVHQRVLEQLVQQRVSCANEYAWIKYLRFYWEDTTTNLDETNISIKKSHVCLHYGKEYTGSKTNVLIDTCSIDSNQYENMDVIMSVVRNSESCCYLGNYERLANFINCIAHKIQKIRCTKQMESSFGNPFKAILKSKQSADCCYYIQDCHLLNQEVMSELLNLFRNSQLGNKPFTHRSISSSVNLKAVNHSNSIKKFGEENTAKFCLTDVVPLVYNPVFLHIPRNQNTFFTISRQQYRSVSLAQPTASFTQCYIYLIQQIVDLTEKTENLTISMNKAKPFSKYSKSVKDPNVKSQSKFSPSAHETVSVLSKIFNILSQLQMTDNNGLFCIEVFLKYCKNKISRICRSQQKQKSRTTKAVQKLLSSQSQGEIELHDVLMQMVIEYLEPLVQPKTLTLICQYIESLYPYIDCSLREKQTKENNTPQINITIVTGLKDCLNNYNKLVGLNETNQISEYSSVEVINLAEYTEKQIFGKQNEQGLLSKIFYSTTTYGSTQSKSHPLEKKRMIVFNGISERLIKYLYSLSDQTKVEVQHPCENEQTQNITSENSMMSSRSNLNTPKKQIGIMEENKSNILSAVVPYILDMDKNSSSLLEAILTKFFKPTMTSFAMGSMKNNAISSNFDIEIHTHSMSNLIDPKVITTFKIQTAINKFGNYWKYLEERISKWINQISKTIPFSNDKKLKITLLRNCVTRFYRSCIKGLWKDLLKVSQSANQDKKTSQSPPISTYEAMVNSIKDFLNILQTILPQIMRSDEPFPTAAQSQFQKSIIFACIYSLCYVYRVSLENDPDYIKLENAVQKMQAQTWIGLEESQKIKPDEFEIQQENSEHRFSSSKKRLTFFDFVFDGFRLIPIQKYCKAKFPERILERGQFYLIDNFIHFNLVTERTLKTQKFGVLLRGPTNSGKTSFCNIYKALHHEETSHLLIHIRNKNKNQFYQKLAKILSIKNMATIGPKLNYGSSLLIVDDLSLPLISESSKMVEQQMKIQNIKQITTFLSSIIENKHIYAANNFKRYKVENVGFIVSQTTRDKNKIDELDDCMIKCEFTELQGECSLKKIFTQIFKANVLDPQVQQQSLEKLMEVGLDIFEEIKSKSYSKARPNTSLINLEILKKLSLFASHLRFKPNSPSTAEVCKFWVYMLKDTFQPYCNFYGFDLKDLESFKKHSQAQAMQTSVQKSICEYFLQPLPNILYSHLFVKQQLYGNGKEVEHVKDIRKLYNSINQTIQEYNKTDKIHRYGYSFEFISLDQLIVKIVKMSNILVEGDYAVFSRKGSEANGIIKLVSYLQGVNYKEKPKQTTILDIVLETIPELTKVSSYLITMKVDDTNIEEFLHFYDCDFEGQVAGSLLTGNLESIQLTGAFHFGIEKSQQYSKAQALKNSKQLIPPQLKASSSQLHSHTASKDMGQTSHNRTQSIVNTILPQETLRINKPSLRMVNKMKKSIKLVYEFNDYKYLKYAPEHPHHLPTYILSQVSVDFFEEYPQESIIRFSQQILGIHSSNDETAQVKELIESSKTKLGLMQQVYFSVRQELSLTLKQYEECIRLYWSFIGTFPDEIKQKMRKYESILDMNSKLNDSITEINGTMELKWEQKKNLAESITKARSNSHDQSGSQKSMSQVNSNGEEQIQKLETKLSGINSYLQQLTQKKSDCQKIVSFFKPSLREIQKKYRTTKDLSGENFLHLKITLVVIASYFTYLSKLPFVERKLILRKWFEICPSLMVVEQSKRVTSISDIFCLIREQDMVINEQNEEYYQNMTIILQSIKPVLIRDDRSLGRNWMKSFDTSFATVSQQSPNFYEKLGQYLGNSNNILLQITDQETLNNSQTNFINSLIFMSENTPKIQINDEQYVVSKESKVYIIISPYLTIPQEILSEHLCVNYEQDESSLIKTIEHQILIKNEADKYCVFLEHKKKENFLLNQCISLELNLANMVWHQFYGRGDEDEDLEESKEIEMVQELKTKEELLLHIDGLAKKGVVDKLQQFVEKYNGKVKVLQQVREKISVLTLPSNYNQSKQKTPVPSSQNLYSRALTPLNRITNIISRTLHLLQKLLPVGCLSALTYYSTIKSAIQQNLININFASDSHHYNIGMFYLYVCRQWGQGLNRSKFLILCLIMMAIMEKWFGENIDDMDEMEIVREFVASLDGCINDGVQNWAKNYLSNHKKSDCLSRLAEMLRKRECGYSMETIEFCLVESLHKYLDFDEQGSIILLHNSLPSISKIVVNPTTGKPNKMTNNIITISSLPLNPDTSANIYTDQQILKYIVLLTGDVDARLFKNEFESEDGVKSLEEYSRWIYGRVVGRLVDGDLMEINGDNVEVEIKRVLHEKLNIFLPMFKSSREDTNKYDVLLSSILSELLANNSQNSNTRKSKADNISTSQLASSFPSKVPQDFKIYIYHPNPKQIINVIARQLHTSIETVYEKLFIKNVENQMFINFAIAKQLRSKYTGKNDGKRADGDGYEIDAGSRSNSHQFNVKNIVQLKTKTIISQQYQEQKPMPVPSMHMLDTQQGQIISNPSMLKSSKFIGNGGQVQQQLGSPCVSLMYESVNKILLYLHSFLSERAGHVDFGGNYFNSWYFQPSYFNGIQRIVQGIANDNDDWNGFKSMAVICRIFKNLIVTSLSFFLKSHFTSLMDKLVQRFQRPMVELTSINRIKSVSTSTKGIDENKELNNENQMKKALDILGQALDQDLGDNVELCGEKTKEKHYDSVWNRFKEECQFVYFDKIWLQQIKQFLGIELIEKVVSKSSESILNAGLKNINEGLAKRSSRRSKNIVLPCLDLLGSKKKNSKETKQTGFKPIKNQIIQESEQKQAIESAQNKFLTEFSAHQFQIDIQTISTKLNLIKDDHQKMKRSLQTDGNMLKMQNRSYWLSNVIYSMCLVNGGGLMCNSWRAYVKECLPRQECQYLSVTLKSLIDKKCDVQRQLTKLAKDPYYSVDLISCSNPIDLIKSYIACQFESKVESKQKNEDYFKNKKKQQASSYCISNILTEEEKKEKFIKLKSVLAVGWKLSSEGTYELTQQDKLTQLTNIYICKKTKPQQMALCSVELFEDVTHKSASIKLNVFTKKNVGNICTKAVYVRT